MADEYLIIKREECPQCSGLGAFTVHPVNNPSDLTDVRCSCKDGYIETQANLLDVLKKLRWNKQEVQDGFTYDVFSQDIEIAPESYATRRYEKTDGS